MYMRTLSIFYGINVGTHVNLYCEGHNIHLIARANGGCTIRPKNRSFSLLARLSQSGHSRGTKPEDYWRSFMKIKRRLCLCVTTLSTLLNDGMHRAFHSTSRNVLLVAASYPKRISVVSGLICRTSKRIC